MTSAEHPDAVNGPEQPEDLARPAPAVPRTPLVILSSFLLITLGLGWIIGLPLVLLDPADRGEAPMDVIYHLFMLSPAVAAVLAHVWERRQPWQVLYPAGLDSPSAGGSSPEGGTPPDPALSALRPQTLTDALGITPLRPISRLLGWSVLALLLFFGLSIAALPVGGALGVYAFDPSMPIFLQELERRLGHEGAEFLATGLIVEVGVIFGSAIILVFLHAGQEMGWRGYLFPRLQHRWGATLAVLVSGLASGLWYAPLLAVGFFYGDTGLFEALGLMVVFATVIGGLLAWLRMRSGSIWPAAFAQSMITAAAILAYWFAEFGPQIDLRQATLQGWSGWILPALLLTGLLLARHRAFAPAHWTIRGRRLSAPVPRRRAPR